MVNNIKNNTISEIDAKKRLNTLNIIKKSEIKHRRIISGQKKLLNLFDDFSNIILINKKINENENENENEDEDDYYDYKNQNKTIKRKNDILDKIIGKSKSFEEQIESLKKLESLRGYWP